MSKSNIVPLNQNETPNPNRLSFTLEEMLAEFENGAVPRSKYWKELITALYDTANHVVTGVTSVADVRPDNVGNIPLLPKDIDAPAMVRMDGADERERQSTEDVFGRQLFYGDACKVVQQYGHYYEVLAGIGYVAGIRFSYPGMQELLIDEEDLPTSVWLDISILSDAITDIHPIVQIVVSDENLVDYLDEDGVYHFLEKISQLEQKKIIDLRLINPRILSGVTHDFRHDAEKDSNINREYLSIGKENGRIYKKSERPKPGFFIDSIGNYWNILKKSIYDLIEVEGKTHSEVIKDAIDFLSENGGGTIVYFFDPVITEPIELRSGQHHNLNGKTVSQGDNVGVDIFKTQYFDELEGVGPLIDGPVNFSVYGGIVNGNYLDDYSGRDANVNNTKGYGFRLCGSQYDIDVRLYNTPEVAFYSEATNYGSYVGEPACTIKIFGRVSGKDGIIFRGPADIEIGTIFFGRVGWLPTLAQRNNTIVYSDVYPSDPVSVMVADKTAPYKGSHEFKLMHLYGNWNGLGYRTIGGELRLKGYHLICENCRGGANFHNNVWGSIPLLEVHTNGRQPSELVGSISVLPAVRNRSAQSFDLNIIIRQPELGTKQRYIGYDNGDSNSDSITTRNGKVHISYHSVPGSDGIKPLGNVANLRGRDLDISIIAKDVRGDVVNALCTASNISVNAATVEGNVVRRISDENKFNGNHFKINARSVSNCIYLDGFVNYEKIDIVALLNEGETIYSGDEPNFNISNNWEVTAVVGGNSKSSSVKGRTTLHNNGLGTYTQEITHNFFKKPNLEDIIFSVQTNSDRLEFISLKDVTDETFLIDYRYKQDDKLSSVISWKIQI